MSQALYRIWRPASWEEVVGQDHIIQTLKNAVAADKVSQAYLFAGPRGTGKTTTARLLAKAVNCLDPDLSKRPCNACENCIAVNEGRFLDLIEIDAASNTSVDDIRELRDNINFSPSQGRYKVYIIDEVHMLSTSAFNALLKTLEEPPSHVIFVLATTEIHKIPATVLSRCQRHEFRRIPVQTIIEKLKLLCAQEHIEIEDEALSLVARQATGSLRDAISLIDQLSSIGKVITLETAQNILGTATSQAVLDLGQAIQDHDSARGLEVIHTALDAGTDPRQFARQVVDYLRTLLVIKLNGSKDLELLPEVRSLMEAHAQNFSTEQLIATINQFNAAATDLKANWHPGLGLELAFAASLTAPAEQPKTFIAEPISHPVTSTSRHPEKTGTDAGTPKVSSPKESSESVSAPQPAPVTSAQVDFNLDNLQERWDQIKREVRQMDQVAGALLNSSRIVSANDALLTLGFSSDLLREKMMSEKMLRSVRKVLSKYFLQVITINSIVFSKSETGSDAADVIPNGLVDMTLRELGGRVRKTTPKNSNEKKDDANG
ncbi:MAG TPA: DNA polymerase III subunit gamma/tau [Anaerolineaceae bacterium]|nr:DNA polymerase III subunit gamma/tau [Anaerolineaceae bacterium]